MSVCTCSKPTPAGLFAPDQFSAAAWPLNPQVQRLPRLGLSALNSMAFGLAVYASQCGLLRHHARLASSCWSGSTGRAFHPQGSADRFQSCQLHLILLSQALLGAMGATRASYPTSVSTGGQIHRRSVAMRVSYSGQIPSSYHTSHQAPQSLLAIAASIATWTREVGRRRINLPFILGTN